MHLSLCATTTEAVLYSLGAEAAKAHTPESRGSATREATAMTSSCTVTREQPPLTARKMPEQQQKLSTAKNKQTNEMIKK